MFRHRHKVVNEYCIFRCLFSIYSIIFVDDYTARTSGVTLLRVVLQAVDFTGYRLIWRTLHSDLSRICLVICLGCCAINFSQKSLLSMVTVYACMAMTANCESRSVAIVLRSQVWILRIQEIQENDLSAYVLHRGKIPHVWKDVILYYFFIFFWGEGG